MASVNYKPLAWKPLTMSDVFVQLEVSPASKKLEKHVRGRGSPSLQLIVSRMISGLPIFVSSTSADACQECSAGNGAKQARSCERAEAHPACSCCGPPCTLLTYRPQSTPASPPTKTLTPRSVSCNQAAVVCGYTLLSGLQAPLSFCHTQHGCCCARQ